MNPAIASEAELLANRHFTKRLLATSGRLVYIHDLVEHRNLYANGSILAFLGYTAGQVLEVGPQLKAAIVHPKDREAVDAHHAAFATATDEEARTLEFRVRHADGQWRWVSSRDVVFARDADGAATQLLCAAEDITGRKLAELALAKAHADLAGREALLNQILDTSSVAIFLVDMAGRLTHANQRMAVMFGRPVTELVGMPYVELIHPSERQEGHRRMQGLLASATLTVDLERLYYRADQTPFWGHLTGNRAYDAEGREVGLVGVIADTTENRKAEAALKDAMERQRRLEQELNHTQKLESLGSLAGGIAHDMNNVLAAVLGMVENLKERHAEDPKLIRSLGIIEMASTRGRDLVRSLTNFARKELREPELVDLNQLVRDEMELLHMTTAQRVDLVLELEDADFRVLGERGTLGSALMNLCVNALDAMAAGGTLTLRTQRLPGEQVALTVQDTGHGMTPEVLARAMEPFFTSKPAGKGTGLGLAMVYATVKTHGGLVELTSAAGQGTTVAVRLPLAPAAAAQAPAEVPAAPIAPLRLLLVDDDFLIRTAIPVLVAGHGHGVVTASGGQEALELLASGLAVDLVILDLNMPGLNGLETLERLRLLHPDLPVILATGHLDLEAAQAVAGDPWVRTVAKPFAFAELDRKFKELLPASAES